MKKQVFIAAITALQKQEEADMRNAGLLQQIFPDADSCFYPNDILTNTLVQILKEEMNDKYFPVAGMSWIEFFCFELNYGKNKKQLKVNDQNITLETPAQLYDFLTNAIVTGKHLSFITSLRI